MCITTKGYKLKKISTNDKFTLIEIKKTNLTIGIVLSNVYYKTLPSTNP